MTINDNDITALIEKLLARIPKSVTPKTRIEVHPVELIKLTRAYLDICENPEILDDVTYQLIKTRIQKLRKANFILGILTITFSAACFAIMIAWMIYASHYHP